MVKLQRVEVEWWDTVDQPDWQSIEEASEGECPVCFTTGRFLSCENGFLTLAPTVNCSECSVTRIPLGCVKAVYKLKRDGDAVLPKGRK